MRSHRRDAIDEQGTARNAGWPVCIGLPVHGVAQFQTFGRKYMRLISLFLAALTFSILGGCTTAKYDAPHFSQPGQAVPDERISPDSKLILRFARRGDSYFYDLIDRSSKMIVGSATSGITKEDFFEGRFRGTQEVLFAADDSGVIITEDLSDAGPCYNYILIHRDSNGILTTRYLEPPYMFNSKCPVSAFSYVHPFIASLTAKTIGLYYGVHKNRSMQIDVIRWTPTIAK